MGLHVIDEAKRCLNCKKPRCQEGCHPYPDSCDDPDAAARRDAGGGRNGVCQQSAVCHLFSGL